MKIIIIGSANPLRGGLASFNERLALECIKKNYDTSIYSFSLQYPKFLFPGVTQFTSELPNPLLKIISCINSINPFNWIKIGFKIKKEKPDFIFIKFWLPFMGACFGTILRLVKYNKHTKIICIVDNIIPHEKRFGDNLLTNFFIKPIDHFITMSKQVFNDVQHFQIKKPTTLLFHPLYDNFGDKLDKNLAKQKLNIHQSNSIILFFGFIRKYKGLDILLNAIGNYLPYFEENNLPPPTLLIAGEFYTDSTKFYEIIQNKKLKNHIILKTDFIPDKDVKYYFSAADLVVQPYLKATQSGVTPLAYHFEVPMIVTNVGGLPEIVPNNVVGYVAEPNEHDIAQKIIDFYKNTTIDFVNNIQIEKEKYSWSRFLESIINLNK